MKLLITGGCGFVGSNFARHMLEKGHDVIILDNMSRPGSEINLKLMQKDFPNLTYHRRELDDIQELLQKIDVDLIYHFAAQVAVTQSYQSPKSDFRVNASGTFNLVSSTDVPVIFASTNKVYGDNVNEVPLIEQDTRYDFDGEFGKKGIPESFSIDAKKHTPYGVSKLTGEMYVREFNGVANRFSCMYGESQFGTVDQGWVSHFVISKLKNMPLTIYGDGKQVRDLLYIKDVCRLLELQGNNIDKIKGEVFNIGGGFDKTISLLELCKLLDIKPDFADWRPADQKVYYSDITKAERVLGWKPEVGVEQGIENMSNWIKENIN
jgi:CDP-paratose 2-epimerase